MNVTLVLDGYILFHRYGYHFDALILIFFFSFFYPHCNLTPFLQILFLGKRYVLGHEAMERMSKAHVLIIGLKGLGVEIGNITS